MSVMKKEQVPMTVLEYPTPVAEAITDIVHAARRVVRARGAGAYIPAVEDLKESVARLEALSKAGPA